MSRLAVGFALLSAVTGVSGVILALGRTAPEEVTAGLTKWRQAMTQSAAAAFGRKHWLATSSTLAMAVLGLIVLLILWLEGGPAAEETARQIAVEDAPVQGVLKPASAATPPNACDGYVEPSAIKVLFGDNAAAITGMGKSTVLQIGLCEALSVERTAQGVYLNARVNDGSGLTPATIRNNEVSALDGSNYKATRTFDQSRVTVKTASGTIVLQAQFLNPTTIRVQGVFGCASTKAVVVKDDARIAGAHVSRLCSINSRAAILVD